MPYPLCQISLLIQYDLGVLFDRKQRIGQSAYQLLEVLQSPGEIPVHRHGVKVKCVEQWNNGRPLDYSTRYVP